MFGNPGALTMYSTAERGGMLAKDDKSCGPADYSVTNGTIQKRDETVAPFDTTAGRSMYKFQFMPGPASYFPVTPSRNASGSPVMLPDYYPAGLRRGFRSTGPGPIYKPMDQFTKMTLDAKLMDTKKPRVNFEKFVSNCCPTIYHPQDIRCFVEGADGRVYPWKMNRRNKSPGPKYNTYGIQTSRSRVHPPTDFSRCSKRPQLFKAVSGSSPADFTIPRELNTNGGIFLSKTSHPKKSDARYFDIMNRRTIRDHIPHPFEYSIPSCFDKESSKAVSAPFKSTTKLGGGITAREGPGPADYFKENVPFEQVSNPKIMAIFTTPPDQSLKSFNTTEPRFFTLANNEQESRPDPCAYTLKGFVEEMEESKMRHRPAFPNPKLGFLISSIARPDFVFKKFLGEETVLTPGSPRRPWRNMRPKKPQTYPYHGPPKKYPNSPGPIYDAHPGFIASKAKKTWNDPRRFLHDTAFLVSGCSRDIKLGHIDRDIPGPGKYYPQLPAASGGKLSKGQTRFPKSESVGPGPSHRLHEKADSSIWRASHLGTYNSKLKQIGISYPSAGGFHAKVLDQAGDKAWRIQRKDDYAKYLLNPAQSKAMASVLRTRKDIC